MRCANVFFLGLVLAFWGCTSETETDKPTTSETPDTPVTAEEPAAPDSPLANATIEVGCAKCSYKMAGVQACALAAKVKDASMLVTGKVPDVHDLDVCAEGKGATKSAVVDGKIEGGELVATKLELK